ncbi:Gfo/Idh/MocA family protein [Plastorhodobacter daqingensis]|uniref:Gfo/Idh/MocA family protein n=1 Tax=Plastorhodobacter daqingensis TaxID=1387281 RepID=A0ABW2UJE4_9RHOB
MTVTLLSPRTSPADLRRPRLGFLGLGWIGRHRMEALSATDGIEIAALCDPSPEALSAAQTLAPGAWASADPEALLAQDLDGLVIATPSAQHAAQSIAALERGMAVFCQKPLGRNAAEAAAVVQAARRADRLLAVDLSYRHTAAMAAIRPLLRDGALGRIFAVDLTFHNAYGPDKAWFHDRALSGGGCVMDLGVHLVDLVLWALDHPKVVDVQAHVLAGGAPLDPEGAAVEDFAAVTLTLAGGTVVRLACSWNLPAGCDADIGAAFYGTAGGAALRNVNGSFFDFTAERFNGTQRDCLAAPPDQWGGRAAVDWARRLAEGEGFDPDAERLVTLAQTLDAIYAAAGAAPVQEQSPLASVL